jgi:hypothetical protein
MSEENSSVSTSSPSPKRNNGKLLLIGIAMALGLVALIALNMH